MFDMDKPDIRGGAAAASLKHERLRGFDERRRHRCFSALAHRRSLEGGV